MDLPINFQKIAPFMGESDLFHRTQKLLQGCLEYLSITDPIQFDEMFHTDFNTVMNEYKFMNEGVSFSKNFLYEPPLEYISVWIKIYSTEDDYLAQYTAFFDEELNCFDEELGN